MNNTCFSFRYNSNHEFPSLRITLSVLLGITSITAVSLNSLILYSIWKNPSLHKPSYLLLSILALSDFLFGTIGIPLIILVYFTYINRWFSSYCYLTASSHLTGYWLGSLSLYSLTLMSIDRTLAVKLKNRYRSFVTSRRIWMVTIPYWIGMFLLLSTLLLTNTLFYAKIVVVPCFLFAFLTTITVSYAMSFHSLKKLTSSVSSSSQQPPDNQTNNFDVSQYRRSLITMILVMLTTILLYAPYLCALVNYSLKYSSYPKYSYSWILSYKVTLISELIAAVSTTVNPLLYLWRMQDIRQAVKTTVKRILRREQQS